MGILDVPNVGTDSETGEKYGWGKVSDYIRGSLGGLSSTVQMDMFQGFFDRGGVIIDLGDKIKELRKQKGSTQAGTRAGCRCVLSVNI